MGEKKESRIVKIGKIVLDVLMYAFLVIAAFAVIITVTAKRDSDGTATVFGYQFRLVESSSMEKNEFVDASNFEIKDIPLYSMVFVEVVPEDKTEAEEWYSQLKEGDVLTFKYAYTAKQEVITHRIISTPEQKETGGYVIKLQGDNRNSENGALTQIIDTSQENSFNYVIGKVVGQSYPLGLLMYALQKPVGLVCIVIIPCCIIIALEVIRIVTALTSDKRKKEQEEREKQSNEIEELKRQIEALKKGESAELEKTTAEPESQQSVEESSETENATEQKKETELQETQKADEKPKAEVSEAKKEKVSAKPAPEVQKIQTNSASPNQSANKNGNGNSGKNGNHGNKKNKRRGGKNKRRHR